MVQLQGQLANAVLKDPDVQSLTSFVGVDGTNMTVNSGRLLINLKPHDEREQNVSEVIRRLRKEGLGIQGITLYMQPVQDLTIETSVNRAQYSFVLENSISSEFQTWMPKLMRRLNQAPELSDVANNMAQNGLAMDLVIDRETAARFGITPATVDNVLYDSSVSVSFRPSTPNRTSTGLFWRLHPRFSRPLRAFRRSICRPRPQPPMAKCHCSLS